MTAINNGSSLHNVISTAPTMNHSQHAHDAINQAASDKLNAGLKQIDAGLKDLNHYQRRLPSWRYYIRTTLIPIMREETPSLAKIQSAFRTPAFDSYFAMTANLGTHTFFMAALPVCFWCGFAEHGVALVQMLALGVYLSGYIKDMLCLPRPLSPPLQRITMSESAALEYGFPSTHTTNAVSVAAYCLYQLYLNKSSLSPTTYTILQAIGYIYSFSISLGRIYCGMHGYSDVVAGAMLGAFIAWIRVMFGAVFDQWVLDSGLSQLATMCAILLLAVGVHPEPADNCPCFDDSVAFIGVVLGVEAGTRSWSQHAASFTSSRLLQVMYDHPDDSILAAIARVVGGITIVFVWRAAMKPVMLKSLPPIFRFVDYWGFRLPRRFFLQARDYTQVPPLPKDDNVLPPASRIPSMLSTTFRNPRKRTISIGPQSEADVREHIANREQRRRNSRTGRSGTSLSPLGDRVPLKKTSNGSIVLTGSAIDDEPKPHLLGNPTVLLTPAIDDQDDLLSQTEQEEDRSDEVENQKMIDALQKPRVRYDVEVITKLVVYAGIGWLSVYGCPRLFGLIGLS